MKVQNNEPKIINIEVDSIRRFKDSWPCNNIPESVDFICAVFDGVGDLVDLEIEDSQGDTVEIPQGGEPALAVLLQDAFVNCHEMPRAPGILGRQLTY